MSSVQSKHIQAFVQTIARDVKLYQQLLTLLQAQKALYFSFDGEALDQNIEKQVPLYTQLQKHASLRSHCLLSLKLPQTEQSVARILNALPQAFRDKVRTQWAELHSLIHQCQTQNQENGQCSAQFHEMLLQLTHPSPTYDTNL